MTPVSQFAELSVAEPVLVDEFGRVLRAAGFIGQRVREVLGAEGAVISRAIDRPLHVRKLAELGPLGTLVKLLVLDLPVSVVEAEQAFAPLPLERLARLGIFEQGEGELLPLVRVVPHDDLLIASDRRLGLGEPARAEHVAGVHAPSLTLSYLTVRRPVRATLDVGTGCGIQAILASRHSERVVAVDLNRRALDFVRFNAHLNGAANVEVLEGSFFEPVEGARFDLVVSNPPYVISPESEYLFRDSSLPGDAVSREVVRNAPSVLEEGGFAHILVSWVHEPGDHWAVPLRAWLEGSGCDAWLLHYGTLDPLTHAGNWNRDRFEHDPDAFSDALGRWLDYYERLGIRAIAHGAVILRRRAGGTNWVRADELPPGRLGPAGEHILRVFAAQDLLAGEPDLLAARLSLAARTRLAQTLVLRDGDWEIDEIVLSLEEGLGFCAGLDRDLALLLARLDGRRTLGEIVDELTPAAVPGGAGRDQIVAAVLPVARSLLAVGFLETDGQPRESS